MIKVHRYEITLKWTGNTGSGTSDYRSYERKHELSAGSQKPVILGSSDPAFRGDPERWNPEELFVASLSACHKLWYLHLCSVSGVVVVEYVDHAEGLMEENPDGSGHFQKVTLRPEIVITPGSDRRKAEELHDEANKKCFIANSVNFPVLHEPKIEVLPTSE
ncbi:MAG: OsmC family protein [Nitrososphaerota archaeon]|nr:OsmC family protein [Nitrososphaerota archaeon]MDG6924381.1 OsmC family protein [Nitrososphaerota archaeon]